MTEEQIEKLIDALTKKRDGLLEGYVTKLGDYAKTEAGAQPQGLEAIEWSGLLNDLDRHITTLHLELDRIQKLKKIKAEVSHA